jgi:LuxR family transcriptional regulator, maltose regulon positive regulatory protein
VPGLGTLDGEARALPALLSADRRPASLGCLILDRGRAARHPHVGPEIAAELFLSVHTVKSQAMSVYRKLGLHSRSQAVARARKLGLLER